MGRRAKGRLLQHPQDRAVGAVTRRAASPIGDRHEGRIERFKPADRLPEGLFGLGGLWGGEFEGDIGPRARPNAGAGDRAKDAFGDIGPALFHAAFLWRARPRSEVQIFTVSPALSAGGSEITCKFARPASDSHRAISGSAKPSLRCWCCSRRNSSRCGAKSAMISLPPAATMRAASLTAAAGSAR